MVESQRGLAGVVTARCVVKFLFTREIWVLRVLVRFCIDGLFRIFNDLLLLNLWEPRYSFDLVVMKNSNKLIEAIKNGTELEVYWEVSSWAFACVFNLYTCVDAGCPSCGSQKFFP